MLRALGCMSCDITHETGGTICYGHWVLRLEISRGTICYGHWVLRFVVSHKREGVRFVTGIGVRFLTGIRFAFCDTRDRG